MSTIAGSGGVCIYIYVCVWYNKPDLEDVWTSGKECTNLFW